MATEATRIVVTVNDQHLAKIQSVVKALKAAGMNVANTMATSGIITGAVAQHGIAALKKVPGVEAVEVDQEMKALS